MKSFKKKLISYINRGSSTRLQSVCIVTNLLLIFWLFNGEFKIFHSTDQRPDLKYITPKKRTGFHNVASFVDTGLFVRSFSNFDINDNSFRVNAVLWFEFDPSAISLETVGSFSVEKGTILYKSKPSIKVIGDKVLATYEVKVEFSTNLDYQYFPFSDHQVFFVLTNKFVSPNEMVYKSSLNNFLVADNIYAAGWKYVTRNVDYGYMVSSLEQYDEDKNILYPRVLFTMNFAKSGFRQIFLIIIPILLMYFMSLFTLSLDVEKHARSIYTLSVGSITSLLAYRFVIERLSPTVGYFMLSDYLYIYILIVIFFVFLFTNFSVRTEKHSLIFDASRIVIIVVLHVALLIVLYYLLKVWQG